MKEDRTGGTWDLEETVRRIKKVEIGIRVKREGRVRKEGTWGETTIREGTEGEIGEGRIRVKDKGRGWMSAVRGIEEEGRGEEEWGGERRCYWVKRVKGEEGRRRETTSCLLRMIIST